MFLYTINSQKSATSKAIYLTKNTYFRTADMFLTLISSFYIKAFLVKVNFSGVQSKLCKDAFRILFSFNRIIQEKHNYFMISTLNFTCPKTEHLFQFSI